MPDNNLQRLVHKNLMYSIRTVVGSELFKHLYVRDKTTGREFDALNDGADACAYVVSGILALYGLIDHPHATVPTTVKRMQELGWVATKEPRPGDVVEWDATHLAFYIGNGQCIGNATSKGVPTQYSITLPDGREPIAYYTHPQLHDA